MLKTRDFYLMKVYGVNGKYLGVIQDIAIDFYKCAVVGFVISSFSLFKKKNFIHKEDIVSIGDEIVIGEINKNQSLVFSNIKHMDIIDNKNVMLGVLEDLIIDKVDLSIKGIIISSGVIDKMFKGKIVVLPSNCILCDEFILYTGKDIINLKTLPHNLGV